MKNMIVSKENPPRATQLVLYRHSYTNTLSQHTFFPFNDAEVEEEYCQQGNLQAL